MGKMKRIPQHFSSLEEMHDSGFYLASEIPSVKIEQRWQDEMKKQKMTISDLAHQTGIHRQSLYTCLSSDNNQLSLESAIRICYVLKIPFEKAFYVDPGQLYSVCFYGGNYVWINKSSLTVLPEAERKNMKSWTSKQRDQYEVLYRSLR